MDDEQRGHLEAMQQTHQRRLRVLEQQAARTGTHTRPEVVLEIDDIRVAIAELDAELTPVTSDSPPPALAAPLEEQRKLVTVLRAYVQGLSDLIVEMDPEDAADLLTAFRRRGEALFTRFGAQVDIENDGQLLALWGEHTSREDDPEQAVRAALALRDELATMCAEQQIELSAQIGLSTGFVLVGGSNGIVGEAMTLAGRLSQQAEVGSILITHDTYRHVRGLFDIELLEMTAGKNKPAPRYLVTQAKLRPFQTNRRGIEGIETRMIGREAELKCLQESYSAASEDQERAVVTVIAEAGLGKSRLLYEFNTWVELLPEKPLLFKGRAIPATQQQPYVLLRDLFALQFGIQDNDSAATVCEKVELGFGAVFGRDAAGRQRAQIVGHLLGFVPRESPLLHQIADDARQVHDRGMTGLTAYFQALADTAPVLLLLEDIHWADDSSLDVVTALAESLENKRFLIVCAGRPSLIERRPHWGEGRSFHTRLDLRPLSSRESRRLVEAILQPVDNVPAKLRDMLVDSAEGNPFYVEELIKMLIDDGAIRVEEPRWTVDSAQIAMTRVPTTLVGVLQARLDNLPALEQTMLQRASVVGRIFWDATIAEIGSAVADRGSSEGDSLPQVFHVLRMRELIYQRERSVFSTAQEYAFKHALLRDVTYERVLKRVRRSYHAGAARWLVLVATEAGRADEYATRIAEHYDHANEATEAAVWYGRAGTQAAARYANTEALGYLNRALTLAPEQDANTRFDLLLSREKLLDLHGDRAAQFADIETLTTLAERLHDDQRRAVVELRRANYADCIGNYPMAIAAAQDTISLAVTAGVATSEVAGHLAWGQALIKLADYPGAQEQLELARALAEATQLPDLEADSLRLLGFVAWSQGDYAAAQHTYGQALKHYSQIGHRRNEARTRNNLGLVMWKLGEYATARASYEQTLVLFREIGDRNSESVVLTNLGLVATEQGDYVAARTAQEQALVLCRQTHNSHGESQALVNLANIAFAQGNYTEAGIAYEQAVQLCRQLGNRDDESRAIFNLGTVALALGNHADAQLYFDQALNIVREIGDRRDEAKILVYLSVLSQQLGDQQTALDRGQQALRIAQDTSNRPDQALAWNQLGHVLLEDAQPNEALEAYRNALRLQEALGQQTRAIEPLAGMAQVFLAKQDIVQAQAQVEHILNYLEHGTLDDIDEPFRVYLTCYQVLAANHDGRAQPLLETAVSVLRQRAVQIADLEQRRSFLTRVPSNRALLAAWQVTRSKK